MFKQFLNFSFIMFVLSLVVPGGWLVYKMNFTDYQYSVNEAYLAATIIWIAGLYWLEVFKNRRIQASFDFLQYGLKNNLIPMLNNSVIFNMDDLVSMNHNREEKTQALCAKFSDREGNSWCLVRDVRSDKTIPITIIEHYVVKEVETSTPLD